MFKKVFAWVSDVFRARPLNLAEELDRIYEELEMDGEAVVKSAERSANAR